MPQYGTDQYGSVRYGGGTFATGESTFSFGASGQVTSNQDSGTATFNFSASGTVKFPFAPTGTEHYLDRKVKDNIIVFNGDESNYPDITIGEESTFTFYIKDTVQGYDAETRYDRVKDLEQYAGYPTVERTLTGAYYSEDSYPLSDRDSMLVSIEPGDGVDEARGVWGIVQSIDDSTEIFGAVARIEMSVLVLAEFDEFRRPEVESEYKADF